MNLWELFFTMELFFAALALGLIVSLVISYFFSLFSLKLDYGLELEWAKKEKNENKQRKYESFNNRISFAFWAYLVVILILAIVLVYSFQTFADITTKVKNTENVAENASVTCLNNTTIINNYNLTVNQITIKNPHDELSIKELQNLINRRSEY